MSVKSQTNLKADLIHIIFFSPSIHFLPVVQFTFRLQPVFSVIGWGGHQETFNLTSLLKHHVSFNGNLLRSCRKSDTNKRVTCKLETVPVVSFSSCSATINKPPHEHLESFLPICLLLFQSALSLSVHLIICVSYFTYFLCLLHLDLCSWKKQKHLSRRFGSKHFVQIMKRIMKTSRLNYL